MCNCQLSRFAGCGAEEDRTPDLLVANQALSQLSYSPVASVLRRMIIYILEGMLLNAEPSTHTKCFVGLSRVELLTSRLSGVRSNHLSYRPIS